MRNAFGFLPSRYECGSIPFPSLHLCFFLLVRENYLNDLNFYCTMEQILLHSSLPRLLGRQSAMRRVLEAEGR